jgi:hypothetical protein
MHMTEHRNRAHIMTSPRTIRAAEALAQECIRAHGLGIASMYGCATSHEYCAWLCTVRRIPETVSRNAARMLRPLRHAELSQQERIASVVCVDSPYHMGQGLSMDAPNLIPAGSMSDAFGGMTCIFRGGV